MKKVLLNLFTTMTAKEIQNKLGEIEKYHSMDIPVCIQHLKLNIKNVYLDTSTDGKVPYINIQIEEDIKI